MSGDPEQMAAAREAKKEKHESVSSQRIQRAKEADLLPEQRRKADYIISQLEKGRTDSHLSSVLNEIMRAHERSRS